MRVVITGGAGFIGARLARTLLSTESLRDGAGTAGPIEELVIFDRVAPLGLPDDPRVRVVVGEITDAAAVDDALGAGVDSVIHLASVVSGGAEADLQLGLSVNLDGTRLLLDRLAEMSGRPKLLFASSFAVYGSGGDVVYTDETTPQPRSSYGVQKLCCELLIGDYHRRGLIDGRAMRFPTIAVRPGAPNAANSSFISNIVREPVAGRATVCPVPADTAISLMSPGRLVSAILKVHDLDSEAYGWPRGLLLPAVKVTVGDMLDALEAELGKEARDLVSFAPDEKIVSMVRTWPLDIAAGRATALGIATDGSAAEIVRAHIAESGAG